MSADYPRDLVGYGGDPPDPQWPGGARLALQLVINYEEGGENCVLHGDAASEAFLSEIIRSGLESVPRAQVEAATILNFNTLQTLTMVVLPVFYAIVFRVRS